MKKEEIILLNGNSIFNLTIIVDIDQIKYILKTELHSKLNHLDFLVNKLESFNVEEILYFLNSLKNVFKDENITSYLLSNFNVTLNSIEVIDNKTLNILEKNNLLNSDYISKLRKNYELLDSLFKIKEQKEVKKYG